MIRAVSAKGAHRAQVICDFCLREEPFTCDYIRQSGNIWAPNKGQVRKKITARGWSDIKGKQRCPACEAKRRANQQNQGEEMGKSLNVTPLREPTGAQELEIIQSLLLVYDKEAKRYRSAETDQTVADLVGGGVMPGWVARIRERMFGPDGGNEEMEAALSAIVSMIKNLEETQKAVESLADECRAKIRAAKDHAKTIERIRASVGPKGRVA